MSRLVSMFAVFAALGLFATACGGAQASPEQPATSGAGSSGPVAEGSETPALPPPDTNQDRIVPT